MSEQLSGKVALVTGGSRGIGAAIALRLAEDGADVALTYRSGAGAAAAVADRIREKTGRRVLALQADAEDAEAVERAVEETVRELGRLDVLVNNAGVYDPDLHGIEQVPVETVDRILAVNTRAPLLAARAAARHLPEGGRIVNIGSCLGERVPSAGFAAYAASKAAITGLTKGLARDLGPRGITVNEVAPGATDTDMNPADGPNAAHQKGQSPLGRYGQAEEIAAAVAYLASPSAGYTNGARLGVDGGSTV
ncbi:SDR family oxidoreductase [Streptomyces sp. LP11]|uniref:SDR family oxidoreductase n=1 Tax=Streptomyces pyxinicus TaxID=2970331 RepID=A0ABT2B386_9ACTN|nr:SDR family oxidoreductase [Streptomyces sp. LP11]MCS0602951.1 SDR family oxidoreductase [Streptomyces sp. LP11]